MGRTTATYSLTSALKAVDSFVAAQNPALSKGEDGEATAHIDFEVVYIYSSPSGIKQIVDRDNLEGKVDEWPMPGEYEIRAEDSNGDLIVDNAVWRATHYSKDSLVSAKENGADTTPGGLLFMQLMDTARIENRTLGADANLARKARDDARRENDRLSEVIGKLQKEKNEMMLERDRSSANESLAKERLADAMMLIQKQEDDLAEFKPQIGEIVDRGFKHLGEWLGLPDGPGNDKPSGIGFKPPASNPNPDPAPPGVAEAADCASVILAKIVLDDDTLCGLCKAGIIDWEYARVIRWKMTGEDIGEEPDWSAESEDAVPDAQEGAA